MFIKRIFNSKYKILEACQFVVKELGSCGLEQFNAVERHGWETNPREVQTWVVGGIEIWNIVTREPLWGGEMTKAIYQGVIVLDVNYTPAFDAYPQSSYEWKEFHIGQWVDTIHILARAARLEKEKREKKERQEQEERRKAEERVKFAHLDDLQDCILALERSQIEVDESLIEYLMS